MAKFLLSVLALMFWSVQLAVGTIFAPAKGASWDLTSPHEIQWDTAGLQEPLQMHLAPGGATDLSNVISQLSPSAPNTGSWMWHPQPSIPKHSSFTIIIIDNGGQNVYSPPFQMNGWEKIVKTSVITHVSAVLHTSIPPPIVKTVEVAPLLKTNEVAPLVVTEVLEPLTKTIQQKPIQTTIFLPPIVKTILVTETPPPIIKQIQQTPLIIVETLPPKLRTEQQPPVIKTIEQSPKFITEQRAPVILTQNVTQQVTTHIVVQNTAIQHVAPPALTPVHQAPPPAHIPALAYPTAASVPQFKNATAAQSPSAESPSVGAEESQAAPAAASDSRPASALALPLSGSAPINAGAAASTDGVGAAESQFVNAAGRGVEIFTGLWVVFAGVIILLN